MFFLLSKILFFLLNPVNWLILLLAAWLLVRNKVYKKRLLIITLVVAALFTNGALFGSLLSWWQPEVKPQIEGFNPNRRREERNRRRGSQSGS